MQDTSVSISGNGPRQKSSEEWWSAEQDSKFFLNLQLPVARSLDESPDTTTSTKSASIERLQPAFCLAARFVQWKGFDERVKEAYDDLPDTLRLLKATDDDACGLCKTSKNELLEKNNFALETELKRLFGSVIRAMGKVSAELDNKNIVTTDERSVKISSVGTRKLLWPIHVKMDHAFSIAPPEEAKGDREQPVTYVPPLEEPAGDVPPLPLAAVELKGPNRRLTFPVNIPNEKKDAVNSFNNYFCGVWTDDGTDSEDSLSGEEEIEEAQGFGSEGSTADMTKGGGASHGLQKRLKGTESGAGKTQVLGPSYYRLMMTQILLYAMNTTSGCIMLSSHNEAIFFKVQPDKDNMRKPGVRWLKVLVSKKFSCDGKLGGLESRSTRRLTWCHGLIAMLRTAMSEDSDTFHTLQEAIVELQYMQLSLYQPLDSEKNQGEQKRSHSSPSPGDRGETQDSKKSKIDSSSADSLEDCASDVTSLRPRINYHPRFIPSLAKESSHVLGEGGS